MGRYILFRTISIVLSLLVVVSVVWFALRLAPGDPVLTFLGAGGGQMPAEQVEALREQHGFNDPLIVQYGRFMGEVLRGDLGQSFSTRQPVLNSLLAALPYTARLAVTAVFFSVIIGVPIGVIASTRRNSALDSIVTGISLAGISVPYFFTGLLFMYVFAFQLGLFPVSGAEGLRSLVLPALSLGIVGAAAISRFTRASMIEVLDTDFVRTARAKGVKHRNVLIKHALRNAMIPMVTVVGIQFGLLMSGSVIVESVFSWPGLGRVMVTAILQRDYSMVQGAVIVFATAIAIVNLVVDILYGVLDPRIRY